MKRTVEISTENIKLGNLLQLAGVAGTGGQAKMIINDGLVKVDDEICTKRGKKVYPGDEINIDIDPGVTIEISKEK